MAVAAAVTVAELAAETAAEAAAETVAGKRLNFCGYIIHCIIDLLLLLSGVRST